MTTTTDTSSRGTKRRVTLERTFQAPIEDVWELWTTKDGIESWWGPDGFSVTVQKLELRAGGELLYTMTATGAEQIAYMKQANMPLSSKHRITITEVLPNRRLTYLHLADFIPGVEPYEVEHQVELFEEAGKVRMVLSFEAMHDETWTGLATAGWESELGKLGKALAARA